MKKRFNLIANAVFLLIITTSFTGFSIEKSKKYHESWGFNDVQTLDINNRYGEVKVISKGGNRITIDVVITVEATNEKRADDLLERIEVHFSKTGKTVFAKTEIKPNFKSGQRFSINYEINVPPDKNLNITNKYGNTFINELNASGKFDIQYGNFLANTLNTISGASVTLDIAYGRSNVEVAKNLQINSRYSTVSVTQMNDLDMTSKYSTINIVDANALSIESKYDKFSVEKINSAVVNNKYTHLRINELLSELNIDTGYGGGRVDKVADDFKSVSINNSYGQISLGLGENNYSLDAGCEYCGISFPEKKFRGEKLIEKQTQRAQGKVGNNPGGKIYIRSRYGEIKLN